jgi:hypothetical protein
MFNLKSDNVKNNQLAYNILTTLLLSEINGQTFDKNSLPKVLALDFWAVNT